MISVVVATRNRAQMLERMLAGLAEQTISDFEVVVVDDASTDSTPEVLERWSDGRLKLRTLRHAESHGPATGRDEGWRAAEGDLIAFTDDDCVPTPVWLEALVAAERSTAGAIVMGPTRPEPGQPQSPFTRTMLVERAGPPFETCNILYPRALLERLDGFDRSFPLPVAEDTDLGWRAVKSGAPLVYAPDALVHHAVHRLGPVGSLKAAMRWHAAAPLFRRHPDLRRVQLHRGVFWGPHHEWLLRAVLALVLPRRLWPLSLWLAFPYLRRLVWRRTGPLLAPYIVVYDLVEMTAVARGAVRERVPMI
jgi:glycosyltransferase involved in cell wall biosynthesis